MTETSATTDLAGNGDDPDPAIGLRAVAALRRLTEQLEDLQVGNARSRGWSWAQIATVLGVSKQAVHKKHARRAPRVLLVHRLLGDTQHRGDLRPGPATAAGVAHLEVLELFGQPPQGRDCLLYTSPSPRD